MTSRCNGLLIKLAKPYVDDWNTYRKPGFLKTLLSVKSISAYGRFFGPGMVAYSWFQPSGKGGNF